MNESGEMYLETIYAINEGGAVKSVDIAKKLGVSKPSVNKALNALMIQGYVEKGLYSEVCLNERGIAKAKEILKKHKTITGFLMLSLGLDYKAAEADACRIEHIISDEAFDRMTKYINTNKKQFTNSKTDI